LTKLYSQEGGAFFWDTVYSNRPRTLLLIIGTERRVRQFSGHLICVYLRQQLTTKLLYKRQICKIETGLFEKKLK